MDSLGIVQYKISYKHQYKQLRLVNTLLQFFVHSYISGIRLLAII